MRKVVREVLNGSHWVSNWCHGASKTSKSVQLKMCDKPFLELFVVSRRILSAHDRFIVFFIFFLDRNLAIILKWYSNLANQNKAKETCYDWVGRTKVNKLRGQGNAALVLNKKPLEIFCCRDAWECNEESCSNFVVYCPHWSF